ncbi:MAG: PAS domain-containing protein [Gammaproteobacteria bacterium]|nr:PAS domain-containing protein [Gammaproteobacteria bacterium]
MKKNNGLSNIPLTTLNFDYFKYSLIDFVDNFPGGAHIKESKDFTYLYSNKRNLEVYGLKSNDEITGKTIADLEKTKANGLPKDFVKSIYALDSQVIATGSPITVKKVMLDNDGFVVISNMTKLPLFGDENIVQGILTFSFDAAKTESVTNLCRLYRELHKTETLANLKFLEHIGFGKYLKRNFTGREVDCLLAFINNRSIKVAAASLSISNKTFETYCSRLKAKTDFASMAKLVEVFLDRCNQREKFYGP